MTSVPTTQIQSPQPCKSEPRTPAILSIRVFSSTFKTQVDAVIADLAPDTPANADHTSNGDLCSEPRIVFTFQTGLHNLNPYTPECFGEGFQSFRGYGVFTEGRFYGPGIKAMTDLKEHTPADQVTQNPANLIITTKVFEIRTQKHIAAFAIDTVYNTSF